MSEALSARTREAYGRWWRVFTHWCDRHGRQTLPASPETIAAWLTALADGTDTGRPLARASINQALAAVTLAHRTAGHTFDRKHWVIAMTWSGISRVKAMTEVERQAAPVVAADVRDLLAKLNTARNIGGRNAALLTLGWGAALRRSELVGLDWEQIGEGGKGTCFVRIDERGILITLARSKASQDKVETVVIPRADLPEACEALEAWAKRAALQPPVSGARPWRRPRTWCAGFPATRSGRATLPVPRRPTCRRCGSSSTRATSRRTWLLATSESPTSGRRAASRAFCVAPRLRRRGRDKEDHDGERRHQQARGRACARDRHRRGLHAPAVPGGAAALRRLLLQAPRLMGGLPAVRGANVPQRGLSRRQVVLTPRHLHASGWPRSTSSGAIALPG
jgi:site-specific recombinase XerC